MNGRGVREYLEAICESIDLRSRATRAGRVAAVATVPVLAGFTTACYAAPMGDIAYNTQDEICHNAIDDDADGLTDCDDDDCAQLEVCLGCDDGFDNDGDGSADCSDPSCLRVAPCADELCGDQLDNDADGAVDCDDTDCAESESCQGGYDEDGFFVGGCEDGVDNDGDGSIDCSDPSCRDGEGCAGPEACWDSSDNDTDGLFDCDDPDCSRLSACN